MKIIVLDPKIDASHPLIFFFRDHGILITHCKTVDQAWKVMAQDGEIDLAVIHREDAQGKGEGGFELIKKFKTHPRHQDLPFIITTEAWTEAQCADHQSSDPQLAGNAYLKYPYRADEMLEIIRAVTGQTLAFELERTQNMMAGNSTVNIGTATIQEAGTQNSRQGSMASTGTFNIGDYTSTGMPGPVALEENVPQLTGTANLLMDNTAQALEPEPATQSIQLDVLGQENSEKEDVSGFTQNIPQSDVSRELVVEPPAPPAEFLRSINAAKEQDQQVAEIQEARTAQISPEVQSDLELLSDDELAEIEDESHFQLPYLFKGEDDPQTKRSLLPPMPNRPGLVGASLRNYPVGDSIVPGGAAQSPDVLTLKKYLKLREEDVAALSHQMRHAESQIESLEQQLVQEKSKVADLEHTVKEQKVKIKGFNKEQENSQKNLINEISELKFNLRKSREQLRDSQQNEQSSVEEIQKLKDRVRADIRKIRVREKELEHKLEVIKKDSEVLLSARENRIVELKRRLDLVEFNMELLQDRYQKEQESSLKLKEHLQKAARAMKVAGGFLNHDEQGGSSYAEDDLSGIDLQIDPDSKDKAS